MSRLRLALFLIPKKVERRKKASNAGSAMKNAKCQVCVCVWARILFKIKELYA